MLALQRPPKPVVRSCDPEITGADSWVPDGLPTLPFQGRRYSGWSGCISVRGAINSQRASALVDVVVVLVLAVAVVAIVVVLMRDCGCLFWGQADVSLHTPVHKTHLHPSYSRKPSSYESKLHYNCL